MTTLAYRDGVIAGDSLTWDGNTCNGMIKKCGVMADGSLWGYAGTVAYLDKIRLWLACPLGDPPECKDSELLIVLRDGRVRSWEAEAWCDIEAPFRALGSGADVARGAMAMGASAEQAVKIAADLDAFTGGPIISFSLAPATPEDDDLDIPDEVYEQPPAPLSARQKIRQEMGLE